MIVEILKSGKYETELNATRFSEDGAGVWYLWAYIGTRQMIVVSEKGWGNFRYCRIREEEPCNTK